MTEPGTEAAARGTIAAFVRQLRQRNVFKVATAYAITGWLLIEVVNNVFPIFNFPQWTSQFAILLVLLGFPIALVFAWVFEMTPEGIRTTATAHTPAPVAAAQSQKLNHLILGLIGVAVLFLLVDRFGLMQNAVAGGARLASAPGTALLTRVSLVVPENRPIFIAGNPIRNVALSPDGRTVVYVARNLELDPARQETRSQLVARALDSRYVRDLTDTFDAHQPFFSPDGKWVGYFTDAGALMKVALDGGAPITLVDKINGGFWSVGVWTSDGTIIFSSDDKGLHQVSADGGAVIELTKLESGAQHRGPALLPGGDTVLFTISTVANTNRGHIEALNLSTGERKPVLANAYSAQVLASGHLLFHRDGTLMVAPFDPVKLQLAGAAVSVDEDVMFDGPSGSGQLAVAPNGTLVYVANTNQGSELVLVSEDGSVETLKLPPNNYALPRVASDGNSIAYVVRGSRGAEAHSYDLARGSTTRLTSDDEVIEGVEWSPADGATLLETGEGLFVRAADRSRKLLVPRPAESLMRNAAWSPDGSELAYTLQRGSQHDIWIVSNTETPTATPWLATEASEHSPSFSPDGRWLAYVSDESGRYQVYLGAYPRGEHLAVSITDGNSPIWSADGTQLYFHGFNAGVRQMQAVTLTPEGDSLAVSLPRALFDMDGEASAAGARMAFFGGNNAGAGVDMLPDGRFVMIRARDRLNATEFVLVQNWFEELQRLAPPAPAPD